MIFESEHYGIVLEFVPNGCLEEYIDQHKVLFNVTIGAEFMWLNLCE